MNNLLSVVENTYNDILERKISINDDESLNIIKDYTFEEFIDNRTLCEDFIKSVLKEKDAKYTAFNKNRVTHIIITWLLGIFLARVFELDVLDNEHMSYDFDKLWLRTSVIHDYGYLRKELSVERLTIYDLTHDYDLLTDFYRKDQMGFLNGMSERDEYGQFFSYDYEEIKKYFLYSKEYLAKHKSAEFELNDHGIVGGCLAFRSYWKNVEKDLKIKLVNGINGIKPSIRDMKDHKVACFIAASHNLYKSENKESDNVYNQYGLDRLLSTSPIRVTTENKLLLLLSLVDTIECTKRFSQRQNRYSYIREKTTLQNIRLSIFDKQISVDYSDLEKYISLKKRDGDMLETLDDHISCVAGLNKWTAFNSERRGRFAALISL